MNPPDTSVHPLDSLAVGLCEAYNQLLLPDHPRSESTQAVPDEVQKSEIHLFGQVQEVISLLQFEVRKAYLNALASQGVYKQLRWVNRLSKDENPMGTIGQIHLRISNEPIPKRDHVLSWLGSLEKLVNKVRISYPAYAPWGEALVRTEEGDFTEKGEAIASPPAYLNLAYPESPEEVERWILNEVKKYTDRFPGVSIYLVKTQASDLYMETPILALKFSKLLP